MLAVADLRNSIGELYLSLLDLRELTLSPSEQQTLQTQATQIINKARSARR